jgi:hypothetical protein
MPDTLDRAIRDAIARPLDGATFERCAVDLLREVYPSLRPVEGGNDAGMDGVGELPDGTPFFLIATVEEDARGNIERSIKSHTGAGGERHAVVFATSRPISGRRRIELTNRLREEFGVRLVEVHDRGDFVGRLYRDSGWRRELLGVPGEARALSRLPTTRRPTPEIPLIGRNQEIDQLSAHEGDVVLVGKPGIGKTFLLQNLVERDWGLFDDGWDIEKLEDAIRDMQPARVVVDDAHLKGDRLSTLRQLRTQMDAGFTIAAVTWPGSVDEVSGALPGAVQFEVTELERDQILQVIEELGIAGPVALQAHLVNQAHGRVGLAVTLAYAILTGDSRDVTAGEVLLRDLVGWYTRTLGPASRYVLGFLALSGRPGATLAQVGSALDLTQPAVADVIRGLADGGTLDEAHTTGGAVRLRVQPAELRYALVRDVYLAGAGSLDLPTALRHIDNASSAAGPLLGAIHRGADLDRQFVCDLADDHDSDAAVAFALLGSAELHQAVERWPQFRDEIVREAHRADIEPDTTLPLLLDAAVGNDRAEHNDPDHPLRVIDDHIAASDHPIAIRKAAIEATDSWLISGGDVGVGVRALAHVVRPQLRRTSLDPGLGNTLTLVEGPLPPETVTALVPLWDRVLEIVEREKDGPVGPLIAELHYWVYPSQLSFGETSFADAERTIREVAPRMIEQLAVLLAERPGALRQLRSYGVEFDLEIPIPPYFEVLFPEHWARADIGHDEWERSADAAIAELAEDAKQRSLDDQIELLHGSDAEATGAGISYPRFTPRLAQLLAESTTEPVTWIEALVRRGAAVDLLFPFLLRSVEVDAVGWQDVLSALLEDDSYSWPALQAVLTRPVGEDLRSAGIARLNGRHQSLIESLLIRGEVDAETVERLLDASDPMVARDSAVAIGHGSGRTQLSDLSERGQARWREVIVAGPPDEFWYSEILKRDPELFAEWLRAWFARLEGATDHWLLPHTLKEAIGELPLNVRRELIDAIPATVPSFPLQDIVTELVGADPRVAEALLDRDDLADLHWVCLRRGPSEPWMARALLALDRGWEPERIVGPTMFSENAWSGEESQHWQATVDAFSELERGDDERRSALIDAGVKAFQDLRDRAAGREREERVFGLRRRDQ